MGEGERLGDVMETSLDWATRHLQKRCISGGGGATTDAAIYAGENFI